VEEQPAKHVVWIGGNHDFGCEMSNIHRVVEEHFPAHVHYLKDEACVIEGKTIYGSPWTPNLSTWAFYASDRAWQWIAEDIPGSTDILVLHSPPSGLMLDGGHPDWASPEMLKEITQRVNPELCVFGHIHEGYGEIEVKGTKFANVAYCDEYYVPRQPPKEWEL
jgi:Icc-related predicted phosphoesterase